MNELTIHQVRALFGEINEFTDPGQVRLLQLSYQGRIALSVAPLVFGCLAVVAIASRRRAARSATAILVGLTLYVAYYTVPDFPLMVEAGRMPPTMVAWAPNAVGALFTLVLLMNTWHEAPGTLHGT